ncbi:hypothetical protein HZA40_02740 [Candidatus Peregrinibacteria bacterium]|nr:hypothetical protein [Candidatus Peregrinibacteria bacterium]
MLNKGRVALFFGTLAALCHLVWVVLVAGGWAQAYVSWVAGMHFLTTGYAVQAFDAVKAVELIVMAFVVASIGGFVLAALWNAIVGKHK